MSFGFSVGDFIAGADLAHKLIKIMTETRGASIEYQEALAELCGIQQIFIQISQMSRNEILPKATLNSIAQIIMPSMGIIANFLDRTKHYQEKLSGGNGLSSSWCKVGWALYRTEELKLLRNTLHARLTAINTLLAAANHLPSQKLPKLPKSVAQFQVEEENTEEYQHDSELRAARLAVSRVRPPFQATIDGATNCEAQDVLEKSERFCVDQIEVKPETLVMSHDSGRTKPVSETMAANKPEIKELSTITEVMQTVRAQAQNSQSQITASPRARQANSTNKTAQDHKRTEQDLDTYLQTLFEKAMAIQAEAEVKAKAAQKAVEEAEWRQRIEENIRLKAEADIHEKMERARLNAEEERRALEIKLAAEEAFKKQALEEAKLAAAEAHEQGLGKDKASVRFKDAVGRKFNFPFHICQKWQGIEELIKAAFVHVETIGPHVQAGHYDLLGPDGQIILPQLWERVIEPDWDVEMRMWPMDRPGMKPLPGTMPLQGLRPAVPPPPPRPLPLTWRPPPPTGRRPATPSDEYEDTDESDDEAKAPRKKRNFIKSFMNNKFKWPRRRRSSISSNSTASSGLS
ncbi:hypothetical protein F4808DRAFT_458768 [Astrocystis sublimbata]|nr:hypothetical protein F4808DRAFT_458768 [Astrocystis sublimbata]